PARLGARRPQAPHSDAKGEEEHGFPATRPALPQGRPRASHRREDDGDPPRQAPRRPHEQPQRGGREAPRAAAQERRGAPPRPGRKPHTATRRERKSMAFQLPDLPYPKDALEPHIDARTMEIHHGKHHAAYTNNLNAAVEKHPELQGKSAEELLRDLNAVPEE